MPTAAAKAVEDHAHAADGSREHPHHNLEDAREEARRSHTRSPCHRVVVQLLPGVHLRNSALELTAADSHTLWRGTPETTEYGGTAAISGGVPLANWAVAPGSDGRPVWETTWLRDRPPRQLFVDGGRRPLARSPVDPGSFHRIEYPIWAGADTETAALGFVYAEGETMPAVASGDNVTLTYFASYCTNTVPVAAIFVANRTVLFAGPAAYWSQVALGTRSRFYLSGVFPGSSASLAPGQWWVGRQTLRYAPFPGQTARGTQVIASWATELIRVHGAEDVAFEGVAFKYADGDTPYQPGDCQAGLACATAAVHITGSTGVTVDRCSITSVGSFGVWVHGNSSDVEIVHSTLTDLGAGGVRCGDGLGQAGGRPGTGWNLRLVVNNTLVADGGRLVAAAPGLIAMGNCYSWKMVHNEVTGFPWSGISAGGVSSYAIRTAAGGYNTTASVAACQENRLPWSTPASPRNEIGYNRVRNIATGPGRLSDNGGIYVPAIATDVHHNEVFNVSDYHFSGLGVYGEGGGCNLTISHNVFHDIAGACIDAKWYSVNTAIVNNVCVSVTAAAAGGALHTTGGAFNLTVTRNIMAVPAMATANQSTAVMYGGAYCTLTNITKHQVGDLAFSFGAVDRNLYYADPTGIGHMYFPNTSLPCGDSALAGVSFEVWRRRTGHDAASVVGVAPGFVGAGPSPYSLLDNSVARRMGIDSIDTAEIGLVTPR